MNVTAVISLDDVRAFRQRTIDNGYAPIRVRTRGKAPVGREWQNGEQPHVLTNVQPEAANTGVLVEGLRCVDIDVDDPKLVGEIVERAHRTLPRGALIRRRTGSPRIAMFYRAAEGQPTKRHIQGCNGKIEVLGAGQQAVVHGLHPEGAALTWDCGRGPDTVKRDDLPAISEAEIENFLGQCVPLLAAGSTLTTSSCPYPEGNLLDPAFTASSTTIPKLAPIQGKNDLAAGIESPNWFSELSSSGKSAVIKASLNQIDNRTCDPREVWLRALFAARDAERLGCVDARELALEWSKRGASWTSEADFDTAWGSCNPRAGGVSIGSLLAMGRDADLDLSPWRDAALARLGVSRLGTSPAASSLAPAGKGAADRTALEHASQT